MPDKIRAFIAIKLPDFLKERLQEAQGTMLANKIEAKYIPFNNMHLTLKFIGNMDIALLPEIKDILTECAQYVKPIKITLKSIGVFPTIKLPKVMWAGIKGETHKLEILNRKLEQKLSILGIQKEKRNYQGHLTLARFKKNRFNAKKFEKAMKQIGQLKSDRFTLDKLTLFQSKLMPKGPIYTELFSAKFGTKL
ncbi:MAG: RNA 2',3'-cyclic phosphodiesterase [Desulfobacula sp.]|nr:RNA 2',3'-cyclic phosphodiesterase [Desulfobacula sp.]